MPPPGRDSYRNKIFDSYLESSYEPLNDLSEEGLQKVVDKYRVVFGDFLPASKDAAILEIGCGSGRFLEACRQLGYSRLCGIDISPQQVALCRQQGLSQVECADAQGYLAEHPDSFDLVVMSDVLEHLPKAEVIDTLEAIYRSLLPNGEVLLKVPNLSNPLNLRSRYVDFTHESGLTLESVQQILRVAGFEILEVRGTFRPHRRLLARWLFDHLLWRCFMLLYRHTLHLTREVIRGKALVAHARRPADAESAG